MAVEGEMIILCHPVQLNQKLEMAVVQLGDPCIILCTTYNMKDVLPFECITWFVCSPGSLTHHTFLLLELFSVLGVKTCSLAVLHGFVVHF